MATKKLSECTEENLKDFAALAQDGYLEIAIIDGEQHYQLTAKGKQFFAKSADKEEKEAE